MLSSFPRFLSLLTILFLFCAISSAQSCYTPGADTVSVSGELKQWHNITLSFDGPYATESCIPNPFFDYRLNVTFVHQASGTRYYIPGYFAVDGNAAETSADSGHIWRCHFSPDHTGTWSWTASFRQGAGIAIDPDSTAGTATDFDGLTGTFSISPTDKISPDLRAKGRLEYVGERYLKFAGSGEYFVKGGADAPENFLAYDDFDNTPNNGGRRKSWSPHIADWNPGDPEWQGGKGHGIIGAINYLASEGMNVFSFLVNNIDGDDDNVFPFIAYNDQPSPQDDRLRYDISKMDQWEIVFAHGESKGMYLHFKLCETENDQLLDGGYLGDERKLFFRMMMARYGHHLALNWNMGEENDLWNELNDPDNLVLISWMKYFHKYDPYHHHIVAHSYPSQKDQMYEPLLGIDSAITGASMQTGWHQVHEHTKDWLQASADSGHIWVVSNDEQGSSYLGVPPYNGYQGFVRPSNCPSHDDIRHKTVWGSLMAGGGGVEFYFGYSLPQDDLGCQDYRSRDTMWDYTRHALTFFYNYLPFAEMESRDDLVSKGYCFGKAGERYAWYLSDASQTAFFNIPTGNTYQAYWYDPRNGGSLVPEQLVSGGTKYFAPTPPSATNEDWVMFFLNSALVFPVELTSFSAELVEDEVHLSWITASEQQSDKFVVERSQPGKAWIPVATITAAGNSTAPMTYQTRDLPGQNGIWRYRLKMIDLDGGTDYSEIREVRLEGLGWDIYPQPASDRLTISSPVVAEKVEIRIYNLNGQLLEYQALAWSETIDVSVDALPAGTYFLKLAAGQSAYQQKISIQR